MTTHPIPPLLLMDRHPSPLVCLHPPGMKLAHFQPPILSTHYTKLMAIAPRFSDFFAIVDVPNPDISQFQVQQIIFMESVVWDEEGEDVMWLATRLFLQWMGERGGVVVTMLRYGDGEEGNGKEGEELDLNTLLEFARQMKSVDYEKCVGAAMKKEGMENEDEQGDGRVEKEGIIETEIGEFEMVRTASEEDLYRMQEGVELVRPETPDNSDWTTHLP